MIWDPDSRGQHQGAGEASTSITAVIRPETFIQEKDSEEGVSERKHNIGSTEENAYKDSKALQRIF